MNYPSPARPSLPQLTKEALPDLNKTILHSTKTKRRGCSTAVAEICNTINSDVLAENQLSRLAKMLVPLDDVKCLMP